jgi:hypothetical protein
MTRKDPSAFLRNEPPAIGSRALLDYVWADACDLRLFAVIVDTTLNSDYFEYGVFSLFDGKKEPELKTPGELALKKPGARALAMRGSSQEFLEMFVGRLVDNFQIYIVDIIRLVLRAKPEILSARKQEFTLGQILAFPTIDALVQDTIESKVTSLSYDGFGELEFWCNDRGIPLLVPQAKREVVVDLIATRNLIAHNRGIVDARYLKAVPGSPFREGQKRLVDANDFLGAAQLLHNIVVGTDAAVALKFNLPVVGVREVLEARWRERSGAPAAEVTDQPAKQPPEGS